VFDYPVALPDFLAIRQQADFWILLAARFFGVWIKIIYTYWILNDNVMGKLKISVLFG